MTLPEKHLPEDCQRIGQILTVASDKWSVLVMAELNGHPLRFKELRAAVDGISERMLTVTLRNLERDGFVIRTAYPTVPPRVEYTLSERGQAFKDTLRPVGAWVLSNRDAIDHSRRTFDRAAQPHLSDGK